MYIKSPCIKICKLQDNMCIGCYRTLEEIANWSYFTDIERLSIINDLADRKNKDKEA
jgi:predicted Fe-S protein YdhL (DUF1289 family)